jgi:hypothetical protein
MDLKIEGKGNKDCLFDLPNSPAASLRAVQGICFNDFFQWNPSDGGLF